MTQQEKHARIEKALFGREWTYFPDVMGAHADDDFSAFHLGASGRCKVAAPHWHVRLPVDDPWDVPIYAPPDYSADLNLVFRAQARIAERGLYCAYLGALRDVMPDDYTDDWWFVAAPASARVDAMIAMIQAMGK